MKLASLTAAAAAALVMATAVSARLLKAGRLDQRYDLVGLDVRRYALPDEQQPAQQREGEQYPEGRPGEIHPEVAQTSGAFAG